MNTKKILMHNKFCIFDKEALITGSYNWTYYAETRNIENIVITNDASMVSLFRDEFMRLIEKIKPATESPRLSWEEIEERENINFHELNYEIGTICRVRNLPFQNVIKTETKVHIIETKRTPYSSFCFGIIALDENNRQKFEVFIGNHIKLPTSSENIKLFFDSENENECPCDFVFGSPNNQNEWKLIKGVDIFQIAQGAKQEDLPIHFTMHLDVDGHLRVDVSCPVTGKTLRITSSDVKFVKYE